MCEWHHFEVETDPLGDTIIRGEDDTGTFVVLEVVEDEEVTEPA